MSIEDKAEEWEKRIKDIKEKISILRKEGKDPFFAADCMTQAKGHIPMALATESKEELEKVETLLSSAEHELKEESDYQIVDVRKEIQEMYDSWLRDDAKKKGAMKAESIRGEK
ncbi:MAG: hypothetical protein ABIA93_04210 [Candidatus Woesearchaeota archaeon]